MKYIQIPFLFTSWLLWQQATSETNQVPEKIINRQSATEVLKTQPFAIGETITWQSKTLSQQRTINVYLPVSYHSNSEQKYPVIYLLDGSADEDFIHIAGLVQFGSFPWIKMLQESIVVGIANVDRKHDMTFPSGVEIDQKEFPTSGGSADFMTFIDKELKPLVNKTFRTQNNTTLIGQSLGGLLATEILLKQPDMFNNYLIVSPSLWWDKGSLLTTEAALNFKNKSIFIAVGKEGPVMEKAAKSLFNKIKPLQATQNRIEYQFFAELDHGDTLHQAAYAGFKFLFEEKPDKLTN